MYDSPQVREENVLRLSIAEGVLSCSKARYYNPGIGRFVSEDPLKNPGPEGLIQKPEPVWLADGNNLYRYVENEPIGYKDAYGLRICESGNCSDCPSGIWIYAEASASVFGFFGGKAGTTTYKCIDNDVTCRYWFWCFAAGGGFDLGAQATFGVATSAPVETPSRKKCECSEDLTSWFVNLEGGYGKGIKGVDGAVIAGPGPCSWRRSRTGLRSFTQFKSHGL